MARLKKKYLLDVKRMNSENMHRQDDHIITKGDIFSHKQTRKNFFKKNGELTKKPSKKLLLVVIDLGKYFVACAFVRYTSTGFEFVKGPGRSDMKTFPRLRGGPFETRFNKIGRIGAKGFDSASLKDKFVQIKNNQKFNFSKTATNQINTSSEINSKLTPLNVHIFKV